MITKSKLLAASFFILIMLSVSSICVKASSNTSNTAITRAEGELALAYDIVSSANEMGADVSDLLPQLDLCADYLSEAYSYFRSGDSVNADHYANMCYDLIMDVKNEAISIRNEVQGGYGETSTLIIRSVVDVFVVLVSSFGVWRILKHYKIVQLKKMRPEVVNDEA